MERVDKRKPDELRPVSIETDYTEYAGGSVLICCGKTRVLCTAMVEDKVPPFLTGSGRGWLTAEYAMLPSATPQRKKRENYKNGPDGRSTEISRLIGRSLRCAVKLSELGERTVKVDCDVLQADGGTRTASITGGYVAVALALSRLGLSGALKQNVAAVSVGVVKDQPMLDLCYVEDSGADADVNLVMSGAEFVEVQGTGERRPIEKEELLELISLGEAGIMRLYALQNAAIEQALAAGKDEEK